MRIEGTVRMSTDPMDGLEAYTRLRALLPQILHLEITDIEADRIDKRSLEHAYPSYVHGLATVTFRGELKGNTDE